MSAARNRRLAWMSQEINKGKTNAMIVVDCMVNFPGTSERVARKELKELLRRLMDIELESAAETKARYLEIGFKLMEDARALGQLGPAVNQFKTLAIMAGALNEKQDTSSTQASGTPENDLVRERIKQLMKSKQVREQAKEAGINLEDMKDE